MTKTKALSFNPYAFADLPAVEDINASILEGEVCLSLFGGEDISAKPEDLTLYHTPEGLPVMVEAAGQGVYRLPEVEAALFARGLQSPEHAAAVSLLLCPAPAPFSPILKGSDPMTKLDLSPYFDGLTPDPEGMQSARRFAPMQRPTPLQRLEDFVMGLTHFYDLHTRQAQASGRPALTSLQSKEAAAVFLFAASGFFAIMQDTYGALEPVSPAAQWKALNFGLMWARSERNKAAAPFSPEEKEAFSAALINPHMLPLLPQWASRAADRPAEAGRFGAWAVIVHLLEQAALLEDGETEDTLAQLMEAFAHPSKDLTPPEDSEEDAPRYEKPDVKRF